MTRREDAFPPVGAKAVCIPDALCLSQQHFLFGKPTESNETKLAFFSPSRLTVVACHGHLGQPGPEGWGWGDGNLQLKDFKTGRALLCMGSFYQCYSCIGNGQAFAHFTGRVAEA